MPVTKSLSVCIWALIIQHITYRKLDVGDTAGFPTGSAPSSLRRGAISWSGQSRCCPWTMGKCPVLLRLALSVDGWGPAGWPRPEAAPRRGTVDVRVSWAPLFVVPTRERWDALPARSVQLRRLFGKRCLRFPGFGFPILLAIRFGPSLLIAGPYSERILMGSGCSQWECSPGIPFLESCASTLRKRVWRASDASRRAPKPVDGIGHIEHVHCSRQRLSRAPTVRGDHLLVAALPRTGL